MQPVSTQQNSVAFKGIKRALNHRSRRTLRRPRLYALVLVVIGLLAGIRGSIGAQGIKGRGSQNELSVSSLNPVVQWNKALLVIVRTHGAQPTTVHPTHSFALLHAAIYNAVNSIHTTYKPYLVDLSGASATAPQDAAVAAAAHEMLTKLYPAFQSSLDSQLQ